MSESLLTNPNTNLSSVEDLRRIDAERAAQIGGEVLRAIPDIEMPDSGITAKPQIGDVRPSDIPTDTSNVTQGYLDAIDAGELSTIKSVSQEQVKSDSEEAWDLHDATLAEEQLTEEKAARLQAEQEIEEAMEAAMFDSLTGLPNRAALKEYTDKVGVKGIAGVAVLDLVDFKSVNDHFGGHAAGDEVLVKFADIMRQELSELGMPCRTGGDEFTTAIFANSDPEKVQEAFARIKLKASELRYERTSNKTDKDQRETWQAGASIGYATSAEFNTLEQGLKIADDSMYNDKDRDHKNGNVLTREERR